MKEQKYKEQVKKTSQLITSLDWSDPLFYSQFLAQTFYYVNHSTRLLARAVSLTPIENKDFYNRAVAHISEENHHEILALQDLKALKQNIANLPELALTKAFYESQYYKIDTSRGISLLGYILFLEVIAIEICPQIMPSLLNQYGPKACRFLKVHSEEDIEHVEQAAQLIESLPEKEQEVIWSNYDQTATIYNNILNECRPLSKKLTQAA